MSLTDKEIRDLRERLEATPKAVLVDEAIKHRRDSDDTSHHVASIRQDLERSKLLANASIKEIDATLGGPYMRDLILAVWLTIQAGDPLSSPPIENTIRVSHPDSSVDEGASTRRFRRLSVGTKASLQYHLNKVTEIIHNNLDYDPEMSEKKRFAAHHSNHSQGYHEGKPNEECPKCREDVAS